MTWRAWIRLKTTDGVGVGVLELARLDEARLEEAGVEEAGTAETYKGVADGVVEGVAEDYIISWILSQRLTFQKHRRLTDARPDRLLDD